VRPPARMKPFGRTLYALFFDHPAASPCTRRPTTGGAAVILRQRARALRANFAVDPEARAKAWAGICGRRMSRDYPHVYWRGRPENIPSRPLYAVGGATA